MWLISEHFRTNHTTDHASDMVDLVNLQWFGDENMTKFRYVWDSCVQSMYPRLPDDTLRDILYKKLLPSKVLREDLARFDRQEQGHPHRTYAWLRSRIDYHILRQLQDKNQAEKAAMFKSKQGAPMEPSAAPAKDKTQPKAKAKAAPSQTTPKERGCGRGRGGGGRESATGRAGGRESAGRAADPGRSGSNDKDRPKPKAKAKAGSRLSKLWCAAFLKGDCKHGESCNFPHLEQVAVDKIKKALVNNRGS